jgi:hypothetical protein
MSATREDIPRRYFTAPTSSKLDGNDSNSLDLPVPRLQSCETSHDQTNLSGVQT